VQVQRRDRLRRAHVVGSGVHGRASLISADVAPLAQLKDLRELALNADMAQDSWQAGLAEVPEQWSRWGARPGSVSSHALWQVAASVTGRRRVRQAVCFLRHILRHSCCTACELRHLSVSWPWLQRAQQLLWPLGHHTTLQPDLLLQLLWSLSSLLPVPSAA
jgi:ribosome modulation factor